MAKLSEMNEVEFKKWFDSRPPTIQTLIEKCPPNLLYRMKSTGHRCTIIAYSEDGTMRVAITGQFNKIVFGRAVFGIPPEDLEECDLPGPEEVLGEEITDPDEILAFVNSRRSINGLNPLTHIEGEECCMKTKPDDPSNN